MDILTTQPIILVAFFADLCPMIVGIVCFRYLSSSLRLLLLFSCLVVVFDIALIHADITKSNNLWQLNMFTLIEYVFLSHLFASWQESSVLRVGLRLSSVLVIVAWLVSWLAGAELATLSDVFSVLLSLVFVASSTYTLHTLIASSAVTGHKLPAFWISAGVLLYFAGNVLLFASQSLFIEAYLMMKAWWLHAFLNVVVDVFYCGGFLSQRQLTSSGS